MDSRSFILGVACGALVAVAAGWILARGGDEETIARTTAESDASDVNVKRVEETAPDASTAKATVNRLSAPETPTTNEQSIEGTVAWPENQWQKLELEPKDTSWAYYMEQTLLQFLGRHPSTAQFDISRIECRTTKCQLEVVGYDESTEPVWQQVIYDIRQQPWSEFVQYGTSSGHVDGNLILIGTLSRRSGEE